MSNRIDVLDHGYVQLVDSMGSDLSIVRSARVSHDADWRAGTDTGSDERLINYLWKNKHTTPFESVVFTFEVKAPIFVFRQWHRHRTWSFNEISARYSELPEEFYVPKPENIGRQAAYTNQAREFVAAVGDLEKLKRQAKAVREHNHLSFDLYHELLERGWPRELARTVLPVATYSRMFGTVNLLNLLKFLTLRCDAHAQYEIQVYADAMLELIRGVAPVAVSAWEA